jgi:hypothetical protein
MGVKYCLRLRCDFFPLSGIGNSGRFFAVKFALFIFSPFLLLSCAKQAADLQVRQYHLRESMFDENNDPMVRGEIQRRLHGAVTVAERRQKVGQYYDVQWNRGELGKKSKEVPVRIIFEYQQAGTASLIKRQVRDLRCREKCAVEFAIKGEDYAKNGRILTWRILVEEQGRVVAKEQSYLWR